MKTTAIAMTALGLVAACEPVAVVLDPLPLLSGYRDPADQCVRVGENAYTNQFLGDMSDLVGCPVGYEGTGVFVTETGAQLVAETQGFELFSVPLG